MDSNTKTVRTSLFARRVLPIVGIVTLTIALGACQTATQGASAPQKHVVQQVEPPAGVDLRRPADRIEEQLARDAAQTAQDAADLQLRSYVLVQQSIEDAQQQAHAAAIAERQASAEHAGQQLK